MRIALLLRNNNPRHCGNVIGFYYLCINEHYRLVMSVLKRISYEKDIG